MSWQDDNIDDPQDIDLEEGDEPDLEDCPHCGESIPESISRCPHCGQWIACPSCGEGLTGASTAARRARGWFWPVVVAILVAIILVIWHGL
ncbi:MAG: hypothetical protein QUV05_14220 [Phycisphaerae bacterium]|nr:hypothetical protein [Phycisphaerae bacterium]